MGELSYYRLSVGYGREESVIMWIGRRCCIWRECRVGVAGYLQLLGDLVKVLGDLTQEVAVHLLRVLLTHTLVDTTAGEKNKVTITEEPI